MNTTRRLLFLYSVSLNSPQSGSRYLRRCRAWLITTDCDDSSLCRLLENGIVQL